MEASGNDGNRFFFPPDVYFFFIVPRGAGSHIGVKGKIGEKAWCIPELPDTWFV